MGSISDTDTLYPTMLLLINKSEKQISQEMAPERKDPSKNSE